MCSSRPPNQRLYPLLYPIKLVAYPGRSRGRRPAIHRKKDNQISSLLMHPQGSRNLGVALKSGLRPGGPLFKLGGASLARYAGVRQRRRVMATTTLEGTARALVAPGKATLAADESHATS